METDIFNMKDNELIDFISNNSIEYVETDVLKILETQQLLELAIDIENFNNSKKELTYQQECLILESD